jgi:hypothetical protein
MPVPCSSVEDVVLDQARRGKQMRKPPPIKAKVRSATKVLSPKALKSIAQQATYEGSVHHKDTLSFAGAPAPRPGATHVGPGERPDCMLCPERWKNKQNAATKLLRCAIEKGQFSSDGSLNLPRRVWARDPANRDIVYEARRLSSPGSGYKAYPLTAAQVKNLDIPV